MGHGSGGLNVYEKGALGWLSGVLRPDGRATYALGPVEGPTTLPQALVVTTAASEFWIESRGRPTPSFTGGSEQPAGIAVVAGPAAEGEASPYPRANLLLPNPGGGGRFAYATGESFVDREIFRVVVERHSAEEAALRFEWLDRVAPTRPRLVVRAPGRGRVHLTWDSSVERGSGVDTYSVLLDGRVVRTLTAAAAVLRLERVAASVARRAPHRRPRDRPGGKPRTRGDSARAGRVVRRLLPVVLVGIALVVPSSSPAAEGPDLGAGGHVVYVRDLGTGQGCGIDRRLVARLRADARLVRIGRVLAAPGCASRATALRVFGRVTVSSSLAQASGLERAVRMPPRRGTNTVVVGPARALVQARGLQLARGEAWVLRESDALIRLRPRGLGRIRRDAVAGALPRVDGRVHVAGASRTTSGLPATGRSGTRRSSAEPSASSSSRLARIARYRSVQGRHRTA